MKRNLLLTMMVLCTVLNNVRAQRGKNGTVTIGSSTIVNEFTYLTANAAAGATTITVNNSSLNANGRFTSALAAGDLVMIIQMQGASMNATQSFQWSLPNDNTWGGITNYNNCGNYEFREVASVPNGTSITLTCGLSNNYTATGHVQIVRVPRYQALTVNSTISTDSWNGQTGGIIAIEVEGVTTIGTGGNINASSTGFRGAVNADVVDVFGGTAWGSSDNGEGAPKGEGIFGFTTEYGPISASYCRGAPTNGGGGGSAHNSGGGGGSNAGDLSNYNGYGNPDVSTASWINIWNLETPGFATNTSSGGGRGGYSFSNSNQNAASVPPGNAAWGGDNHRSVGGQGGWPLDYTTGKIFIGGGGGAGDQNDGDAGVGGNGGGMVYLLAYGNVTGSGQINANGQNGGNSDITGAGPFTTTGIDGAGGAGGGGTIVIKVDGTVSNTLTLNANGGTGGNQFYAGGFGSYNPAYGPGGGGGGGYIAVTAGTPARNTNGGNNGTTNSNGLTEFPPNGATRGGAGINNATITAYDITTLNDTICSGQTATLFATVTGTVPATPLNWYTTQFGSTVAGTGTAFTTPVLVATTTYYVGYCPGSFRVPVTVVVSTPIVITTAGAVVMDETCAGNDGSISGITVSGGSGTLTYTWNGSPSAGPNLSNAGAGSYTLTVTDVAGCSASTTPFTINSGGGPVINTTGISITDATCFNVNGSITGISASGTGTLTYTWNGSPSVGPDLNPAAPGSYTLQVSDGSGCTSSVGPFTINNVGGVTLDTTGFSVTDATCGLNNGSVTGILVTASGGGTTFTWNGVPSGSIDLTGSGAGSFTLQVTDGTGCSATTGVYVINSVGGATINNTGVNVISTTCGLNNGSISGITASGGTPPLSYSWNGSGSLTADTSGLGSGSYTLTVTDGSGCSVTDGPYTVTASNGITASATGIDATCNGFTDGSATASFTGGNGGEVYQWTGGPATAAYNGLGAGSYTVIITDAQGCADTTTVIINEPAPINASISGVSSICSGNSTTLTATGGGTYAWNTGDVTAGITVSPTSNTNYQCVVTQGACSDTATISVTVSAGVTATISGATSVCNGNSLTLTGGGGGSYAWSTGDTTSAVSITPAVSGTYSVIVSNSCGSDTAVTTVTVNNPPTVTAMSNQTISTGGSASISASGANTYTWSPPTGLSCTTCAAPVASPTSTTTYTVTGTDANGCTDTSTVTITVDVNFNFFIPQAFSPNGDGLNDLLFVRGAGIQEVTFRVYDRWGQKVFESTSTNDGWDGTFRGQVLGSAVFIYTVEGTYLSGESFSDKGNITLQR